MTIKQQMIDYVTERTETVDLLSYPEELTALFISERFKVKRNTASLYLNQAASEGLLVKIETRPVIFFSKAVFEKRFHPLLRCSYSSIQEALKESSENLNAEEDTEGINISLQPPSDLPDSSARKDMYLPDPLDDETEPRYDRSAFSQLVGFDKSLNSLINKLMATLFYPGPKSIPLMIYGESGVGKSFLVKVIHEFCKDNGILKNDAPLVIFNCAQYANNPELMSSRLFGYVRGAFTGAREDTPGLFDAAEGGILFIDEAHRLSGENQEKFFTYLDYGTFTRLGEHSRVHHANVRIILATTENLKSSFLDTFRRRLGMNIYIPSFRERSYSERLQMVYQFLYLEHRTLERDILIPKRMAELLAVYEYPSNVGELEMVIKAMCAAAFARCSDQKTLRVSYMDIPSDYLGVKEEMNFVSETRGDLLFIDEEHSPEKLMSQEPINRERDIFCRKLLETGIPKGDELDSAWMELVQAFMQNVSYSYALTNRMPMESRFEKDILEAVDSGIMGHLKVFPHTNRARSELCSYIYMRCFSLKMPDAYVNSEVLRIRDGLASRYEEECSAAKAVIRYFRYKLQIGLNALDEIILTCWIRQNHLLSEKNSIYALIVGHGRMTAYSMADYVNRECRINVFDSLDIDSSAGEQELPGAELHQAEMVYEKGSEQYEIGHHYGSTLILWDTEMSEDQKVFFREKVRGRMIVMDNASTSLARNIGRMILEEVTFTEFASWIEEFTPASAPLVIDNSSSLRPVLICCSHRESTGDSRLEKILRNAIPEDIRIEVVTCDYDELTDRKSDHPIFRNNLVLAVIGVVNPKVPGYLFVPVDELISQSDRGKLKNELTRVLSEEDAERVSNGFVDSYSREQLIENLTILDVKKVIENIEESLTQYEALCGARLSGRIRLLLLIHLSVLIERLIRRINYDGSGLPEVLESADKEGMVKLKQSFAGLERIYQVEFPDEELYLVNEYIKSGDGDELGEIREQDEEESDE